VDAHRLVLNRTDQFHALGDPTRWRIMGRLIDGPASVQELSRALGQPKGTLSHHVKVLEAAGLVRLAETRRVRGVEERRYARLPGPFSIDDAALITAEDAEPELRSMPLRQALAEARIGREAQDDDETSTTALVLRARMPVERARRFVRLVEGLAAEFSDGAPGTGEMFGLVAAIYMPDWALQDRRRAASARATSKR
jgi:DNA-binding transcriptional ArsR family regulator